MNESVREQRQSVSLGKRMQELPYILMPPDMVLFDIICSRNYISLRNDIGQFLGCGLLWFTLLELPAVFSIKYLYIDEI